MEPFASGITTAVSSIIRELPDYTHIVIHGSRNRVESADSAQQRFPRGVQFIEWKSVSREISLAEDWKALRELTAILKNYFPRRKKAAFGMFPLLSHQSGEEKPNTTVVHLHSSKAGFLGRLACRRLGIKAVVYTPHCGAFLRKDVNPLKRKMYWLFE